MQKRERRIIVSIFMIAFALCLTKMNVCATEVLKTITGFEEFDLNENALHLMIEYKPSLEEITEMMPDTLGVYLDESDCVEYIDVDWFCVAEDYENCENFYFQFSPVWDETQYCLSDEIYLLTDAPYIGVFFTTEDQAISTFAVTTNSNEEKIFRYLIENAGYNVAAACGIMANLYCESAFIPTNLENSYEKKLGYNDASYTQAVDSGKYTNFVNDAAGYGLCQWTYWSRKQQLLNFAKSSGKSIGDLTMQLNFMKKEISGTATDDYARAIPNTGDGAYKVGYYYCENYERPAQTADEKSVYRGNLAKNTYWSEYHDWTVNYDIRISGNNVPGTMLTGSTFKITGVLNCDVNITKITLTVEDYSGKKRGGNSFNPNEKTYDLSRQNPMMGFDKLEPGVYIYKVSASNAKQTKHFIDHKFVVLADSRTIADGKYMILARENDKLVMGVENRSNVSGAKLQLQSKQNTDYQFYDIKHVGSGYYVIKNCGSGKYLDVVSTTSGTAWNVQQKETSENSATKWQILKLGDCYCLVPKQKNTHCLSINNSQSVIGSYMNASQANLKIIQKFKILQVRSEVVFSDIYTQDWFYPYVEKMYQKKIMTGISNVDRFEPLGKVSRAQVVTTLYRIAGQPKVTNYAACTVFPDVERGQYYTDAICWAYNEGITTGNLSTGKFEVHQAVIRQDLALFLQRFARYRGMDVSAKGDISNMMSKESVEPYALEAVEWAVGVKLISGIEYKDASGKVLYDLAPKGTATRAQLAAMLCRFLEI